MRTPKGQRPAVSPGLPSSRVSSCGESERSSVFLVYVMASVGHVTESTVTESCGVSCCCLFVFWGCGVGYCGFIKALGQYKRCHSAISG